MKSNREQLTKQAATSGARRELKTMVFTDMVGSTQLKQDLGDTPGMQLVYQHHQLVRELLRTFPGAREISNAGDSFFLAFDAPSDAVCFSLRLQARLRRLSQTVRHPVRDRIGIHVGEVYQHVEAESDQVLDLDGIQVDTCARVMSLAGADHILLTRFAFENSRQMLKGAAIEGVKPPVWVVHGLYALKGLKEPVEICEVAEPGFTRLDRPGDSEKAQRIKDDVEGLSLQPAVTTRTFFQRVMAAGMEDRRQAVIGAVFATTAGLFLMFAGWFTNLSFDLSHYFRLDATPEVYNAAIAFVTIDNESKTRLDQKTLREWDRRLHAQLIDRLREAQAKAVVFDVVFEAIHPAEDGVFLEAIRRYGKVGVAVAKPDEEVMGQTVAVAHHPFEELATNAWCGLVERVATASLTMRQPEYGKPSPDAIPFWPTMAEKLVSELKPPVPALPLGSWLNFYCPPKSTMASACPYWQVLSNQFSAGIFSNKVVFVGSKFETRNADDPGSDMFRTPYSIWGHGPAPGMVAVATSYLNLARGDWLVEWSPWLIFLLVLAVGVGVGYVSVFLPPMQAFVYGGILSAALAGASISQMWLWRTWYPWLVPCAGQIPCAVVWSALSNSQRLAKEKRRLQAAILLRLGKLTSTPVPPPALGPYGTERIPQADAMLEVPDHRLVKLIGEGAYGQVWLAKDIIGSFHAVKILRRSAFAEEQPYEREFHGLRRFTPISRQHPGLVQILHVGRNDPAGFLYYIMEVGDDETSGQKIDPATYRPRSLSRDVASRGFLPVKETLDLAISLAEALDFLHDQNLIHRDIKPANIIFVNGRPKLADIGLVTDMAGKSGEVTFVGTPGYSAPEGPGAATADIYSLGKLLYVICTGCLAQHFPDLPSSLAQRADADALLQFNNVLLKACEPVVRRRYPGAKPLLADLRRLRAQME